MSPDLTRWLRQLAGDAASLWPDKPAPELCGLRLQADPVADGYAALAPGGVCAGEGWLECAARTAWLQPHQNLAALTQQASPLLGAELVLSATRSRHLRRGRAGLLATEFEEFAEPATSGCRPCLAFNQEWLATDRQRMLVYRQYWAVLGAECGQPARLRPWACLLYTSRCV